MTEHKRIAKISFDGKWDWKATNKRVASAIEREIECTTVEDLPRAEARRG